MGGNYTLQRRWYSWWKLIRILWWAFRYFKVTTTRDELYSKWGPMLFEAVVLAVTDEINTLRRRAGLSPRTVWQVRNSIEEKHSTLELFDFMTSRPFEA